MNFELTEQQKSIQEVARKFAREELLPGVLERDECFIVDRENTAGVRTGKIENKMGIRSAQVSEVIFENCRVPAFNKVAQDGNGFKTAMKTLNCGRIGVAAQGLGIAEGAFERAKEYMKEREQFGKPIAKFQYLQFKMAELVVKIEAAKYMLYKAATDHDTGKPYDQSAAKAKYLCTNVAMEVTERAVFPITYRPFSCIGSKHKIRHDESKNNDCFYFIMSDFIYASNEPKSVLARDLGVAKRQWRLFSND